nr:reverse transcriptase family protein [Clostridium sp. VAP51]
MTYYELINIIEGREYNYINYEISKKSGGKRLLTCPNWKLKNIQKWINNEILMNYKLSSCCTGFRKGMSIKQNAEIHLNQPYILKLDLLDFFPSINEYRVYNAFKKMGYHTNLSVYLAKLVTVDVGKVYTHDFESSPRIIGVGVLPQGSPTSPYLANIIASKLDERLSKLSKKLNICYSRYADDITFSGELDKFPSLKLLNKIIEECGFKINYKKVSLQNKKQGQIITGLSLSNGVKIPKKYKKETSKHLYYCKKYGVFGHLAYMKKNKNIDYNGFREWLLGRIYYINSVEPDVAKKMLEDFNTIEWLF